MKRIEHGRQVRISASDLCNFLECQYLSAMDYRALFERLERTQDSEDAELIQDKGLVHEAAYLARLQRAGKQVVTIDKATPEQMANATLEAMRSGSDVIFQATFLDNLMVEGHAVNVLGYADFLERVDKPSALGSFSYEVHDTKLAKTTKAKFLVQLIIYSELVARVQKHYPQRMHVVTGREGGLIESHETARYRAVVGQALARYASFLADEGLRQAETPEPCDHCNLCGWREHCDSRWAQEDHLSRVANISKVQVAKLRKAGINTRAQLAAVADPKSIRDMQEHTASRLIHQASLQIKAEQTGQPIHVLLPVEPYKGLGRLPEPHPEDLYFDMEGNPLEEGGHLEYLFGLWHAKTGFKDFWALTHQAEKKAFEDFIDYVMDHITRHPGAHIYHYAAYEQTALKRLMTQYGTRESQVDHLLRSGLLIDLYQAVREGLRVSEPKYSIKNLERFYQEKRSGDVTNAGASIIYFEKWKKTAEQKYLDDIRDYNIDDVVSTMNLHRWLESIRPAGFPYRDPPSPVAEETQANRAAFESELASRINALTNSVSFLPEDDPTRQVHELLSYLLDFYRRAEKPVFWEMFRREDMSPDELEEDAESLQGLSLIEPPTKDGKSQLWRYRYPEQPTKIRAGSTVRDLDPDSTRKDLTIYALDEENNEVIIRVGNAVEMPGFLNLGPSGPIKSEEMKASIVALVDEYLKTQKLQPAVKALLYRELPSISHLKTGDPILRHMPPKVSEVCQVVNNLDESLLFIQGPPGTGKTYTGSHVILSLIKAGKRVGVMSNSHSAIHNLLSAVEKEATKANVSFTGLKKSTKNSAESQFDGVQIANVYRSEDVEEGTDASLVAGTAWLFSRPGMEGQLDTLFVDEAGQVSLANLLACMRCAKNVVLLGDQMQLAQPIQGKHPGLSGLSALDYLLNGEATIKPDQGIFLSETWRMAPPITKFISDLVYESRLTSEADNARQQIHWAKSSLWKAQGIDALPVRHIGNAQRSHEEAMALAVIYKELLQSEWTNREGKRLPITSEDILVVAPYNLQVQLLKRTLPDGARVGTVDKFQGQEAAAVLISMATSSQEYLPRDIEFLFSTNRLNVAITRGRAYVGFFYCPDLLFVRAKTPEAMALVNTVVSIAKGV